MAGTVVEVGGEVRNFKKGDRVAQISVLGSYAEYQAVPADKLVHIPDKLDFKMAAASMLQGVTTHYLLRSAYPVKSGETILVHAAAGGVGLLLTQYAKKLGARVIGSVSTDEKAKLAREAGDEIILYTQHDFVTETKRL